MLGSFYAVFLLGTFKDREFWRIVKFMIFVKSIIMKKIDRIRFYFVLLLVFTGISTLSGYSSNITEANPDIPDNKSLPFIIQEIQLSENSEISLLTCGPGDAMYSKFGHSALWVMDPENRIDLIFNYGTFDFSDSNFYYLFLRGIANYRLSITNFQGFVEEYETENRFVKKQILNLTSLEKQNLYRILIDNYQPENRYYRYDFLFLNCSSIIRDRIFDVTNGRFTLSQDSAKTFTFRELLEPYLEQGWVYLGINLLLSHKADREASNWETMFLPDHMYEQFSLAKTNNSIQLAPDRNVSTMVLSTREAPKKRKHTLTTLLVFLVFALILIISNKRLADKSWHKGIDFAIFFSTGLIGILVAFMWFFSKHEVVHQNLNLMWAFPLHLIFAFIVLFPRLRLFQQWYARIFLALGILFYILAILGVQVVPTGVLLIASIVLIRLYRISFILPVTDKIKTE
jgi:hypothetical protein